MVYVTVQEPTTGSKFCDDANGTTVTMLTASPRDSVAIALKY